MAEGYHDFTAGEQLTAANLEGYCQNQSVMRFASAAARDTALSTVKDEGMLAWLDDVNCMTVYSGAAWSTIGPVHGAWTAYTPTWTNLTVGNGTLTGSYWRLGRTIGFKLKLIFGTTTSVSGAIIFSIPVAYSDGVEFEAGCAVKAYDASAPGRFTLNTSGQTTTTIRLRTTATTETDTSSTVPFTWTTSDQLFVTGVYEAGADA